MPATRPPLAADAGTPTALSDLERAKWDEMLLAYPSANRDLLWLYCSTWCDWRAARDGVKLVGPIIRDPKNRPMLNPHLVIARETQKLLADMLIVLGRTEARDATRAPATRLEKFLASKRR
jgi:phage terminase small subunit